MATKFKNSVEIDGYLSISSGNWIQVPDGTTAQRPGSPAVGMFRYNTTTDKFEGYFGSTPAWGEIGGGGGGGTVTEAFKTFAVSGQTSIVADGPTDTLTVAAGSNISLTTNAATDTLTIASTGGSGGGTVTIQRNNYTGNGSTVAYGVSSTIVSENNIQIYIDGVYQDKDGFTTAGSTVTFGTAPPTGAEIEIMHYVAVDGVIEVDEFVGDGTTINFATSLSIINEDATQVYVSGVYQSKLTYGTTGNVVTFQTAPPNGANIEIVHIKALALSGFNKNNFIGTGSQTAFTLTTTVTEENMTFVFLEGIYQDKSTYAISGTTLTFATAPQSGYNVEVMVLGAISASTNALYTDTFTGNGSTTAYALGITPVDLNAIDVYLNGLYQNVSTLSLSANTVTFATAPPSGVIIEIRSVGFLNSGGTLSPATLIGGTGIEVITNSPNNFTINNTLVDVTVSFNAPTGQSLTYTTPGSSSGQAGSIFTTTTFTITSPTGKVLSGTAVITGLPAGITNTQSYNNTDGGNILTITLNGVYPSINSIGTNLVISNLTESNPPLTVSYLVVAGGGGAGYDDVGGGGAGGLRTSYGPSGGGGSAESVLALSTGTSYAVTVGGGGNGGQATAYDGSPSIFYTITSLGGGHADYTPASGGSGGGGDPNNPNNPGAGTANQGFSGGVSYPRSGGQTNEAGGGGGGAGAVGGTASANTGGNGGVGLAVGISGSTVTYAGGGGGGGINTGGTGGAGGGANGTGAANPSPGDTNTGGGGGGAGANSASYTGSAGGSGIVILRYPKIYTIAGLSGSTTTSGNDKVTTFISGTGNITFS